MAQTAQSKYLKYLPAIYQGPENQDLGKFLVPFEQVLTGIESLLGEFYRYLTPELTEPDFLPWLATWVALELDEEWDEARQRELIAEAVELYRWRGTVKGLKRYLEIYTGLSPEIYECRWPSGLQIGVSSQIGGFAPQPQVGPIALIQAVTRREPIVYYDYYLVDTLASETEPECNPGDPLQIYYRADRVEQVSISASGVDIWHFPPQGGPAVPIHHQPATITRRDHIIDDVHTLHIDQGTEVEFHGDTFLIEDEEQPYRFILDVRVRADKIDTVKLDKVRAIVDLEKPAHTQYYLKFTLITSEHPLQPLQIEVRSTAGVDTYVG